MDGDVEMRELNKTELQLLGLISKSLFHTDGISLADADWNDIEKEAWHQAVFPLAFSDTQNIPDGIMQRVKNTVNQIIAMNMAVNYNHVYTHELMTERGIPYVILKGYASAYYYPDPILRAMGDVDFLVPLERFEEAKAVLESEGFIGSKENHICHVSYRRDRDCLELHFAPAGMPEGRAGELARQYMEDIFSTAAEIKLDEGKIRIPDAFHHSLILLFHTCHHMTGEGIGLRHLCDWAVFANHFSSEEFVTTFQERFEAIGIWRFTQILTQLSIVYLGMPAKEWAMEDADPNLLKALICDIFDGGNLGIKDENRRQQTKLISTRGKNGIGNTSMFRQFVLSINNIIYLKWPRSRKWKVLLPFGWLFYCTRYAIKIMLGMRRKIAVTKTVAGASERRDIYKEFHLYEV